MEPFVFQEFRRGGRSAISRDPQISIQRGGLFSLNRMAFELLSQPSHIVLLYDTDNKVVAMRKAAPGTDRAYPVRKQGKSESYLVSGKAFLKFLGFPYARQVVRLTPKIQRDLLVLDLRGVDWEREGTAQTDQAAS